MRAGVLAAAVLATTAAAKPRSVNLAEHLASADAIAVGALAGYGDGGADCALRVLLDGHSQLLVATRKEGGWTKRALLPLGGGALRVEGGRAWAGERALVLGAGRAELVDGD